MDSVLVYITAANATEAEALGRALVERRLAACVNILPGCRSLFWWEGRVQEEAEVPLLVKTAADRLEALTAAVKELHSYSVPCVAAVPLVGGNAAFLEWIVTATRPQERD